MARTRYCPYCLTTFRDAPDACPNLGCRALPPERGWGELLVDGDLLDRHYRIHSLLALGGGGATYLAQEVDPQDVAEGPLLAIKVLYSQRDGGAFLRRLATEAQILQELDHEHIVQCRGFVTRAGRPPYLVTRFEGGGNLEEHVSRSGPLGIVAALGITRQMAEALRVAHGRNVIHRDLKPANVLLARPVGAREVPHVRVADFGIARVSGGLSDGLTRQGAFVGTPQYAAPEQFEYEVATPATDVFALGGILVFMLTGSPPVHLPPRETLERYREILFHRIPPILPVELLQTERGRDLGEVVSGCMAWSSEQRWSLDVLIGTLDWMLGLTPRRPLATPTLPSTATLVAVESTPTPTLPPRGAAVRPVDPAGADHPVTVPPRAQTPPAPVVAPRPVVVTQAPRRAPAAAFSDALTVIGLAPPPPGRAPAVGAGKPVAGASIAGVRVRATGEPVWELVAPSPAPSPLPRDAGALLSLLGAVAAWERDSVLSAIQTLRPELLAAAVHAHRTGEDPARGRGIALATGVLFRRDWQPYVRTLLADPDQGVQVAAMTALGVVATAIDLRALIGLLRTGDGARRVAAVRALGAACGALDKADLAGGALRPLRDDADEGVRAAVHEALMDLRLE